MIRFSFILTLVSIFCLILHVVYRDLEMSGFVKIIICLILLINTKQWRKSGLKELFNFSFYRRPLMGVGPYYNFILCYFTG